MKLSPDKVLGLAGIGPKAMQAIERAVNDTRFSTEPEVAAAEPAPVMETAVEASAPAEAAAPIESVEMGTPVETAVPAEASVTLEAESVPTAAASEVTTEAPAAVAGEEAVPEVSFEELFKLRPESFKPGAEEEEKLDKKGKKGKKSVEYQFDETRGEVVGRKKHKRGDVDWTGEDW